MSRNLMMVVAATAMSFAISGPVKAATIVDLGFAIDESGSIAPSDFTLMKNGLAAALALIPVPSDPTTEPTYRVSIVQFASSASTLVGVTTIDSVAARNAVIAAVNANTQSGGFTAIGNAIKLLTDNFLAAGLGDTSILNVGTDGVNNVGLTVDAGATYASGNGIDALSFEAIGPGANTTALLNAAFPGTPVLVTNASQLPDDVLSDSFVYKVDSFLDYEDALKAKLIQIIDDTGGNVGVVPLPAGLPLLLTAFAGLFGVRRFRKTA